MRYTTSFGSLCGIPAILCLYVLAVRATQYYPPGAVCEEYTIPVAINTQAYTYNGTEWHDNYELADFVTVQVGRIAKSPHELYSGPHGFQASYEIGATFCKPANITLGKEKIVLLATHGLWFERKLVLPEPW